MLRIGPVSGAWGHLANFWFFLAAIFSDILLIRICLVGGFLFLIINAFTGLPLEPDVFISTSWPDGTIFLDLIIWSVVTGSFHVIAIWIHLRDERQLKLDDNEEPIWRYFYRRAGMPRTEFRMAFEKGDFVRYKAGDIIVAENDSLHHLHLLVDGLVEFQSAYNDREGDARTLHSGDLFDLEIANLFGVRIGFESDGFRARAVTNCLLVRWPFEAVQSMAAGPPALASYWRSLVLYQVAAELNRTHLDASDLPSDSHGHLEDPDILSGGRSRDFTEPLKDHELPPPTTFKSILQWLWRSASPFPPPGLRHNAPHLWSDGASQRLVEMRTRLAELDKMHASNEQPFTSVWTGGARESQNAALMRRVTSRLKRAQSKNKPEHSDDEAKETGQIVHDLALALSRNSETPPADANETVQETSLSASEQPASTNQKSVKRKVSVKSTRRVSTQSAIL